MTPAPLPLPTAARRSPAIGWLCFMVAVLEGFDLQVAGIAAPNLKLQMGLDADALGWFFSASTIGLFIGALLGGRMADRLGRAGVLILSVAAFGVASILTGLAQDSATLIAARGLTGLGLGGALPNLLAFTAENAPPGRERRAVALLYVGVPVGGCAVSLTGALAGQDWRLPFFIGGVLPIMIAALLYVRLPRSAGPRALAPSPARDSIAHALFGEGRLTASLLLWGSFFATLVILYLVLNWLPSLLIGIGLDARSAFLAQLAFNAGGILLCALTAPLLDGPRAWMVASAAFLSILLALIAAMHIDSAPMAILIAFCLGGAVLLTQSFLYALAPTLYPGACRGIGVGSAVAAGRLGSIAGPLYGAAILSAGGDTAAVLRGVIPVAILAAATAIALSLHARRHYPPAQ